MTPNEETRYRFDEFVLDVSGRQLWRGGVRIDLNARYFDALALLVREHGTLVEKDRFFSEVWGDVVVSDAALTQCIKDIRRLLGDDAANPRYVRTVPRYGYRFVGAVEAVPPGAPVAEAVSPAAPLAPAEAPPVVPAEPRPAVPAGGDAGRPALRDALRRGVAGTLGGGLAGALGGLLYGFGLAHASAGTGMGTASVLAVLVMLSFIVGVAGGFGVSFGMAAALAARRPGWIIVGAALGGMLVGAVTRLLGVDAFNLLFGRAPAGITGGLEGAALGAAVALGARLGGGLDADPPWRPAAGAGLAGAAAGVLIPLAGGRLLGGSLELLARSFSGSRLQLDAMGRFFGELHFGHTTQLVLGGVEGLIFGSCVAGAIALARRAAAPDDWPAGYLARKSGPDATPPSASPR